jgi:hypothetical protein
MCDMVHPRRVEGGLKGASVMASARTFKVGPRALLAGDGGLLTAAALGVVVALASLIGTGSHGSNIAVMIGVAAVGILVPPLAWWLHGRRIDGTATAGAVGGYLASAVLVFAVVMLLAIIERAATAIGLYATVNEASAALESIAAIAVFVAYLAAVVWLVADGMRDLSSRRRTHVPLDVVRLVAAVVYVAFCVGVIVVGPTDTLGGDIAVFLLAPGAVGAVVVIVADAVARSSERRSHAHLISGA